MGLRSDVVALCVDPAGPYPARLVEWYDADRDARTFSGDEPVVAHPPCGPWGRLRRLCTKQDPSLGPLCVEIVRRNGGVLEHPACSMLWRHCGMPRPGEFPDEFGGVSFAVTLSAFGGRIEKRTWLYAVGLDHWPSLPPRRRDLETHVICTCKRGGVGAGVKPRVRAHETARTPDAMADWLIDVAASCHDERKGAT